MSQLEAELSQMQMPFPARECPGAGDSPQIFRFCPVNAWVLRFYPGGWYTASRWLFNSEQVAGALPGPVARSFDSAKRALPRGGSFDSAQGELTEAGSSDGSWVLLGLSITMHAPPALLCRPP